MARKLTTLFHIRGQGRCGKAADSIGRRGGKLYAGKETPQPSPIDCLPALCMAYAPWAPRYCWPSRCVHVVHVFSARCARRHHSLSGMAGLLATSLPCLLHIVRVCVWWWCQAASEPLETFPTDEFETEAEAVRLVVATVDALVCAGVIKVWEEVPVADAKVKTDSILTRLVELIKGDDTTLSQIQEKLTQEFGADTVAKRRRDIQQAVIAEMQRRRLNKGRSICGGQRKVLQELEDALAESARRRYDISYTINM